MRSIRTTHLRPTDGGHSWDRNDRAAIDNRERTEIDNSTKPTEEILFSAVSLGLEQASTG